jgi:PAS domain S-box-containing protein
LRQKELKLRAANEKLESSIQERTREVAEQGNLLRTLIDHLPDHFFVKDTSGKIVLSNPAHARMLGFKDPAEAVGKSDCDLFSEEPAKRYRAQDQRILETGQDYNGQETLADASSGSQRYFQTTKVALRNGQGAIIGSAGIQHDITERKQMESEMEKVNREMLALNRQAGMAEVATSVLHNIGNNFNSVNVSASVVEDAIRMQALSYDRHGIKLVREYAEVPPISTDRHKILQILINLFQNAKQACDAAQADARHVTVRIVQPGPGRVRVEVTDTGIGIPAKNLTRIFSHGFTTKKTGHAPDCSAARWGRPSWEGR